MNGAVPLAAAGTAVVAIRTGSASIGGLVSQINRLYEESLFVRDLDRLRRHGHLRAIPTGGTPLPERPETITVEDVSFTYSGRDTPALDKVTLAIPRGSSIRASMIDSWPSTGPADGCWLDMVEAS